jgi:hypothetical protein
MGTGQWFPQKTRWQSCIVAAGVASARPFYEIQRSSALLLPHKSQFGAVVQSQS